jgi:hypothetical protein
MGISDSILFPWYRNFIQKHITHIKGNVGFFGAPDKNPICRFIENRYSMAGEIYDIQLNNWDLNQDEWNIDKKYGFIVSLRTAYFSKDPVKLLSNFYKILKSNGVLIIDWGLGSSHFKRDSAQWTFGWEYEGSRCYAEYQGNRYYPWSTFWDNHILETEAGILLVKYASMKPHYKDITDWGQQILREFQDENIITMNKIDKYFYVNAMEFFNTAKFRGKNALYSLFCLVRRD